MSTEQPQQFDVRALCDKFLEIALDQQAQIEILKKQNFELRMRLNELAKKGKKERQ